MTTAFFRIDPLATETQRIDLPIDSVVYIGMETNAISGLFMPSLFLDQNYSTDYKQTWQNWFNKTGTFPLFMTPDPNFPLNLNGLTMAKFWTGYVPIDSTFTAEVHGFTRSFGGEAKSVSRQAYEKTDGSTFLLDSYNIAANVLSFDLWTNNASYTGSHAVSCYIARDSEGTMLGGFSTGWARNITRTVNGRLRQILTNTLQPETIFGNLPFTPYFDSGDGWNGTTNSFVPASEATKSGSATTVSIADYFSYTAATPATFPMHITATGKTYSFIQF